MASYRDHTLSGFAPYSYLADPSVPELPRRKIVLIMDGDCALCSWGARTIANHDPHDMFRIATVTSSTGQSLLRHYQLDPQDPWSWMSVYRGQARTSSDAICFVLEHMGWQWAWIGWIGRQMPASWREFSYRFVARNRIKWFGRKSMCELPTEPLRVRLLDI